VGLRSSVIKRGSFSRPNQSAKPSGRGVIETCRLTCAAPDAARVARAPQAARVSANVSQTNRQTENDPEDTNKGDGGDSTNAEVAEHVAGDPDGRDLGHGAR